MTQPFFFRFTQMVKQHARWLGGARMTFSWSRGAFFAGIRRLSASQAGSVAVITALLVPSLVGFCGIAGETGFWYYRQRDLQAAVDIAAYNGTVVLRAGGNSASVSGAATTAASQNGWKTSSGTLNGAIIVNTPPTSGSHQNNNSVEVKLSENEQRYFTALFTSTPVPINVRAVATYVSDGPACMLGLDKTRSGTVQFWGNATADFTNCNVLSNSLASDSFKVGGAANVKAPCVSSAGGSAVSASLTLTECTDVTTNAPQGVDPYASVPAPTIPPNCSSVPNSGPMSPGKYCNGLTLQGNVSLNPGVYVVTGGQFKINANANITGSGVTFYLTGGATISFNGNAHMNLSAPTSGTYSGILMYGDRTQAFASNTLNGDNSSVMTGAFYFPSQEVDFLGNFTGNNGCLQVVADRIYYTGNGTFKTDCTGSGLATIPTPGVVSLVE